MSTTFAANKYENRIQPITEKTITAINVLPRFISSQDGMKQADTSNPDLVLSV